MEHRPVSLATLMPLALLTLMTLGVVAATDLLAATRTAVAAGTKATVDGPASPSPSPAVASTSPAPSGTAAPAASPGAGEVSLLPVPDAPGERMFTLGEAATVEYVTTLELVEATRGWSGATVPPPDGMADWTFLVRFRRPGASPGPYGLGGGYYNVIGFSLRDDQGFEYPVLTDDLVARQPTLRYGELSADQQVQGWLTFQAPADAAYVELRYTPIADESVFFRVAAP